MNNQIDGIFFVYCAHAFVKPIEQKVTNVIFLIVLSFSLVDLSVKQRKLIFEAVEVGFLWPESQKVGAERLFGSLCKEFHLCNL